MKPNLQLANLKLANLKRCHAPLTNRPRAAARQRDVSYSQFMGALKKSGVALNRKVLADLAMNHPDAFTEVVNQVQS
ncbi:MAG: hypothetical protein BRD45_03970 [Bacteroidetes bacterium QS_8_64_10]|nr:MAG: hypothetical protein BRD45_03970 [Bacteroidetes bacterium QS_8_64_10]